MRKKIALIIPLITVFTVIVAALAYASDLSGYETNKIELSSEKLKELDGIIQSGMEEGKLPGVIVSVINGDETVYQKGFGYANVGQEKEITSDTLFELASNSKAFTALGVLKLADEGYLELTDNIAKYIPWLTFQYNGRPASVTIEQFLCQTSGIPFKSIDLIPESQDDDALEESVRMLIDIELDSEPGSRFQYATMNYDVLGLLIQNVTGVSYESFMKESVLLPLDLNHTILFSEDGSKERMADGYKIGFQKQRLYEAPVYRGNTPAGYIITDILDLEKWIKLQIGVLNHPDFTPLIQRSHDISGNPAAVNENTNYANGWFLEQNGNVYHGGNNPNYSSFIQFNSEEQLGIAVLSNSNSDYVKSMAFNIWDSLLNEPSSLNSGDFNTTTDKISLLICALSIFIISAALSAMVKTVLDAVKKRIRLKLKGRKHIAGLAGSVLLMAAVCYCIYLIPQVFYNGVTWRFVFVWLPVSVRAAFCFVLTAIGCIYGYLLLASFKKHHGNILTLALLSLLSGFGNALVIFTINMALNSNRALMSLLFIFFILGIVLYVYGQKLTRQRLIIYTNEIVFSKRMDIVRKLLNCSYGKFEQIDNERIEATLNNDTEAISKFVNVLVTGMTSFVTLLCCFIYLGYINTYALLLSVCIIILIAGIYYLAGRYANRVMEEARDLQNVFFRFINDLTEGFKELSLNKSKRQQFQQDMEESSKSYKTKRMKSALAFANMSVIGELGFTMAIGAVVFIFPILLKNLDHTSLTSYVFILLYMTGPVHGILNTIPGVLEVRISVKRINQLLKELPSTDRREPQMCEQKLEKDFILKLNNVEYEYSEKEQNGFKIGPINYEFHSGEITFITGGNGSGKSTLAKLLAGLYEPTRGEIVLSNIPTTVIGESFSTVFTDFHLFHKLYGINYAEKENDIQKYLTLLQMDSKVQIQDGKFNTIELSTGQKKRLALLVAYLEDRPICLFDECAADQDPEFRFFFYDSLLPMLRDQGKCVIAITHDDRYFGFANKVIKMELGVIKST